MAYACVRRIECLCLDDLPGEDKNYVETVFERVISIWWEMPHAVNRWLTGSEPCSADHPQLPAHSMTNSANSSPQKIRRIVPKRLDLFRPAFEALEWIQSEKPDVYIAVFSPIICSAPAGLPSSSGCESPYCIKCIPSKTQIYLECWSSADALEKEIHWLKTRLMPRLSAWFRSCWTQMSDSVVRSHRLIDLEQYSQIYQRLKTQHGKKLLQNWTERTNPEKFIFEDLAIAAYFLVLLNSDGPSVKIGRSRFVDVGCGNGLLCHILGSEGVSGVGVDIRSRGIWSQYGAETRLEERVLDPSLDEGTGTELPDADWLIGNHSDELTPWIPVLAARKRCNFFLLPCCCWDFYGKYHRKHAGKSQYRSYLNYVRDIANKLGFLVQEDRLKIPSTKRVCFIGRFGQKSEEESKKLIASVLGEWKQSAKQPDSEFVPREKVEPVKNCSRIPRELQDRITQRIANQLLRTENFVSVDEDEGSSRRWNRGGSLSLEECAALLEESEKESMKAQNKGLQTLLRNHHQTFQLSKGRVALRDWSQEARLRQNPSTKRCWFFFFHPDGCPLNDICCSFEHK